MSKVKYAPLVAHIVNEHQGFTFQTSRSGNVMMKAQSNDRARQLRRQNRQVNLINPAGHWRTLSAPQQAAWNLFAATYPQPSKRNPLVFLTGYQLFLKRNQYCHLNYDIENGFIFEPTMAELPAMTIIPTIEQTQNVLDVTEPYIKQFGIIPAPGQWLLFKAVPMAVSSGQFYETIYLQLQVLESYIDGLFISLELSANMPDVVFSVFLSKPYSQSIAYSGTKTRYMGCFTSKTFLQLTDTPASYVGEGGKTVTVKDDETGLEFTTPTGGGLTCADLPACPEIISLHDVDAGLQTQINNLPAPGITCADLPACPTIVTMSDQIIAIGTVVIITEFTSIPPIKNGLLYNWFVTTDARNIAPSGWSVPTDSQFTTLQTSLGGVDVAGGKLKTVVFGGTNEVSFNGIGSGKRHVYGSPFSDLLLKCWLWTKSDIGDPNAYNWVLENGFNVFKHTASDYNWGYSIRLMKDTTTLTHGQSGIMVGNDQKMYRTICIYGVEWLADNLAETKYRDGSPIPEITADADWWPLTTGALCAYDNDWNNVY